MYTVLYPNTNKELYYNLDYKRLPENMETLSKDELKALYDNLSSAYDNAFSNHSELLLSVLLDDLLTVSKHIQSKR